MGTNWSESEWLDFSSSEEEHVVADDEDRVESSEDLPEDLIGADIDSVRDDEDLVKSSDDLVHLIKSLSSGISCVSAERDDSQGCTAHVKETPPSGISSVRDDEDLVKSSDIRMAQRSFEAFGSSLSSMNDSFIRNQQHSFSRMVLRSMDAFGSGLSSISDSFIRTGQRSPPRPEDLIGADIDSVRDDEDLVKSSDDLMAKGSMESIDSGVSLKSDGSNRRLIDFKDSSSLRPDFSSSEEELDVADDEDWFESLYSL